jgi:hypothetical protein
MKKYLLLASAAVFAISANAQDKSSVVYRDGSSKAKIDNESDNLLTKPNTAPNAKAPSKVDLGSSFNVYTILGDRQNQVVYNKDINTVGFVHRQNAGSTIGGANASGVISFDYSTNGGANWTVNPFALTPNLGGGNGNRYPNITMYNPAGNNDTNNAYVVVTGPQLMNSASASANGWSGTFRASAKLDGTNLNEQYTHLSTDINGDNNEWAAAGLYTNPNGDVFDVSTNIDLDSGTDPVRDQFSKYFINKGVFHTNGDSLVWTADTLSPTWYTTLNATSQSTNVASNGNMAWSPDGMTGYIVIMAAANNASANSMIRPYVMKTTDGGANWSNVMDYDFSQNPLLQCYIWNTELNDPLSSKRPVFGAYDMVVDNTGELRIFASIGSGSTAHPDSLFYSYSARQSNFLFEVATNGANWDVTFVDSILVDDFEWDAGQQSEFRVRPQAARSQDGTKVFYTWSSVDLTLVPGNIARDLPSVFSRGHNLSTGLWTPISNLSSGTPADFVTGYPTIAVETIENNVKDYEIAIVYGTGPSNALLTSALNPVYWHYLREVGFDAADFTESPLPNPCSVSIESVEEESSTAIYPNPTNGVIAINTNADNFNYTVINVVGDVVAQNTVNGNTTSVNLSNNAKGVYFVTINTENGSTTQKVILTK